MNRSNEENIQVYEKIGMYIILVANCYFFLNVLILLFPYVDYQFRNNRFYVWVRNKIPFLKKQVKIMENEARARNNWNKLRHVVKEMMKN